MAQKAQTKGPEGKDKNEEMKHEALDRAISQIEKQFGKGSIMSLGSDVRVDTTGISTGSLSLDLAIGAMGIPRGRVVEIYGPESSGKTTLALHVVASAQKAGGIAAYIDAEHALHPPYCRRLGVDLENLLVSQPDTGEQAMEITELLVRSSAVDVIVVDSVAALVPKAELEGEMGEPHMALQARLMSQALRKLAGAIAKSKTSVVFINQIRHKIGVFFGSPETTPGGNALKFYASVRLDIRRIGSIKEADTIKGSRVRVTVVKNKVAPPFKKAEFDILYNQGINYDGDIVDLAADAKVIDRSGSWFSYGEIRLGQGRERAVQFLRENADVRQSILNEVLAKYDVKVATQSPEKA